MATWRFTMGFRQSGVKATETYYHDASSIVDAGLKAQSLMTARNRMLFNTTEWVGIRIGLATKTRQSQLYTPGQYLTATDGLTMLVPSRGTLVWVNKQSGSDQPNSCIQISLRFDDTRSTKRYLAFIPDEVVSGDPDSVTLSQNGPFADGYTAYQQLLTTQGWMIRARSVTGDFAERDIQAWVQSDTAPNPIGAVLVLTDAPPLKVGDKVAIKAVKRKGTDKMSYNMIYRVSQVVDSTGSNTRTVFLGQSQAGDPGSIKVLGKLQKVGYEFFPIQTWGWFRAGTHKRGVSFGSVRGRRLTRVLLDP